MSIVINHNILSDSPFDGKTESLFVFQQKDVDYIVNDIFNGQPTCYLISGYRGAGKTSFIKKVEKDLQTKIESQKELNNTKFKHTIFVYTNFSRYESQTYLLRKLIRGLYFSITCSKNKSVLNAIKSKDKKEELDKQIFTMIETLFLRTFHDVSTSHNITKERKKIFDFKLDIIKLFCQLLKVISPFLLIILWSLNNKYKWFSLSNFTDLLVILFSSGIAIYNAFNLSFSFQFTSSKKNEFNKKTLYDDEIADFHFNNILKLLSQNGFKIVFVFDELDKVDDNDANKLVKEMKPYLVSGLGSFIVVAGQKLYYKYYFSQSQDDDILSTLFSRMVHVSLFPAPQLQELFLKFSQSVDDKEIERLQPYLDYIKYRSKLVPRRFINLIRQELEWDNDKSIAVFNPSFNSLNYLKYSKILMIIQNIYETEIAGSFDNALGDFFLMQLFIKSERILSNKSKNYIFTKSDI